ncbi:MAG: hypothetical protein ABSF34_10105 [Verrucomicrobiota bacterium]
MNPYKGSLKNISIYLFALNLSAKALFSKSMGLRPVEYGSVFLYKNGFRIHPFGDVHEDKLGINRRKQQGQARFLGTRDLTGRIEINGKNPEFRETSSRDGGLVDNQAFDDLREFFVEFALKRLEAFVVGIIKFGNDGDLLDQEGLSPEETKAHIFDLIVRLTKSEQVLDFSYDPDLLNILENRSESSVSSLLKNFKRIAAESNNKILTREAAKAEKHLKVLSRARQEAEQEADVKASRWDWATQWSLPKRELLTLVVPNLFGSRLDTPHGGNYWGMMGRSPVWNKYLENGSQGTPPATGFIRYTGGGDYAGVLVVLVAIWAAAESLRRKASIFNFGQRKWLWFWLGFAVVSLLLALGRYAPFYKFFYLLPYVSTIRNPTKFLYLFGIASVALFAYGIDGLERRYMQPTGMPAAGRWARFEKYWVYACGLVLIVSLLGWWDYAGHHDDLVRYLQSVRIVNLADSVATFSIQQVGWFILFFSLAAGLLILIFSGVFAGRRTAWGGFLLGLLLVTDLGLANRPWIIFWDYHDKYASNPIIDLLQDKPYEHRVALAPVNLPANLMMLRSLYRVEWMQHQFPFYNVQSFDVVDMPRMPEDFSAFLKMFSHPGETNNLRHQIRAWQLTNTRYVIGPANLDVLWNQQNYLAQTPLQTVGLFEIVHKPGILVATSPDQLTVTPTTTGHFGLFEFPAALPRVKLYSNWHVNPDNSNTLQQIFSPDFDPESSVIVDDGLSTNSVTGTTNGASGTVDFVSYAPKDIVLKADAFTASVLLLDDHFDPDWKVFVDGSPEKLLRCNFLMRGVYLVLGTHVVEFKFLPPVGLLYVAVTAVVLGLLALGILMVSTYKNRLPAQQAVTPSPPAAIDPKPRKSEQKNKSNKAGERKNKTK